MTDWETAPAVAETPDIKLFGKWSTDDVQISDISLQDYIAVKEKYAKYLPHSAGRYAAKRFRKAQCPIVERLTNSMMMHGRNNGKKLMTVRIIKHAFEIIHLLTGEVSGAWQKSCPWKLTTCEAVNVLNRCLTAIMDWMGANRLKLNPDKTETLLVSAFSAQMVDVHPVLDGVTLPLKEQVRSLGVLFDPSLSLEAQVARNAFYHLQLVAQLRPYLDSDDLASVVHALVTSRLDYCNALYVGLPLKTVRKLQLVQNAAARLLMWTRRSAHITPVLARLHWLPICFRARFKVLVLTYKALHGMGPQYLVERLSQYEPTRTLRSTSKALLRVPSHREARRVMTRTRAFSVVAPELWNSLLDEVRLAPTLLSFRRQVETFLYSQAF
ncbi:small ribosomal subunit protein uS7 isoform X1 [Rhineura floridana]|uniref:small ribosomal subunit protein uS7 isoform X1 n=1 Tax=Rhineura floridana TaxID=261503 RepID=UPI002AC837F1|nr:small ribosomal subunit protein uS7 isoform X1 [Rhineura floridana]